MPVKLLSTDEPTNLKQLEAVLLKNRGISDSSSFFNPPYPSALSSDDTGLSKEHLELVAQRLLLAAKQNEEVVIFGDYDADGVCATAILWEALFSLGVRAQPFIPDRFEHGYGLTVKALESLMHERKPDVIITVDNGIVAYEAIAAAKALGIYTIVTDHHHPDKKTLPADLILHSTKLSGSGVSWMLAYHMAPVIAQHSLELAGLATIADQVPLLAANRSVAWHGLRALRSTTRLGLLELFRVAGIEQEKITERSVGFGIAPRINAMGRLASALDALRLICTTSPVRARNLAQLLQDKNVERQKLTQDLFLLAKLQAEEQAESAVLVIHSDQFHEGIIGLIAGRLVEEYHKPAIVIAMGEKQGKGSARSTPAVNMVELLRSVREHLLELGGHPMAAGFSILTDKLSSFRQAAEANVTRIMTQQPVAAPVEAECSLPAALVTLATAEYLEKYAPFGAVNAEPVFLIPNATCVDSKIIGKQANHRKYVFTLENVMITGMAWYQQHPMAKPNQKALNIVATLGIEEWRQKALLLGIKAIEHAPDDKHNGSGIQ